MLSILLHLICSVNHASSENKTRKVLNIFHCLLGLPNSALYVRKLISNSSLSRVKNNSSVGGGCRILDSYLLFITSLFWVYLCFQETKDNLAATLMVQRGQCNCFCSILQFGQPPINITIYFLLLRHIIQSLIHPFSKHLGIYLILNALFILQISQTIWAGQS